jgi:hypothetical protein
MMESLVTSADALKGRVDDFLASDERGLEARALIERLSIIGQVAIFGGMLRDIARYGGESFASDVDLVVDGPSEALATIFNTRSAKRNRFGGYRVYGRHTHFDIWALQDTWAIKQGLVSASSLADLTKTTFFDWDAAVYLPRSGQLHCPDDYLDRLRSGIVTINLKPNPNPLGAVARTLRLLLDWQVGLSEELTEYLWQNLSTTDRNQLVTAQKVTIGRVPLRRRSIKRLETELANRDFFERVFRHERDKRRATL